MKNFNSHNFLFAFRYSLFAIFYFLFCTSLQAQTSGAANSSAAGRYGAATTFMQDYQTVGINPANLGLWNRETRLITFGTGETSITLHTEALSRFDIFNKVLKSYTLPDSEITQVIKDFTYSPTSISIDELALGLSVQLPKFGGIAFTWHEHASGSYEFNSFLSNLIYKGINYKPYFDTIITDNMNNHVGIADSAQMMSTLFKGSNINYTWYREYNLSYGRRMFKVGPVNLYGGLGFKYLLGFGIMDINSDGSSISGFSANSPIIGINYDSLNISTAVAGQGLVPVGKGTAFDFGVTATIMDIVKFGVAVTDVGGINWTGNILTITDRKVDSLKNFTGVTTLSPLDIVSNFNGTDGLISWSGGNAKSIALASKLRFGGSVAVGKVLEFGFDFVQPLNDKPGSLANSMVAFGLNVQPVPAFTFSTGIVTGGNTDYDVPFGISLSAGPKQAYQFGISTGDVLLFVQGNKPTFSMTLGFARFQF